MSDTGYAMEPPSVKTTLINLRTYRGVEDYVLIDRRTPLGNHDFKIGAYNFFLKREMTREDCVALFRKQFERRMQHDPVYWARVERLRGKKMACWCTPLACHGDVYLEYFEEGQWW